MPDKALCRHFELKAVDDAKGIFEGYGSVFDEIDDYQERVKKGAFSDSIQRKGASGIKLLWQHDRSQPIGVYEEIKEDALGLFVRGRLLIDDVQKAKEAYALIKSGALDGLSIGYRTERYMVDEKTGIVDLIAVDLKEISPVTFPANEKARITGVKGSPMAEANQEVELVERTKLDQALSQKAEAEQKLADQQKVLREQAPVMAAVAKLTGKDSTPDQVAELLSLADRVAQLPTTEQMHQQERSRIISDLQQKNVSPDRISALEAAADACKDGETQLAVLRAGAAKLQGPRVFAPAGQERVSDPPTEIAASMSDAEYQIYQAAGAKTREEALAMKREGLALQKGQPRREEVR